MFISLALWVAMAAQQTPHTGFVDHMPVTHFADECPKGLICEQNEILPKGRIIGHGGDTMLSSDPPAVMINGVQTHCFSVIDGVWMCAIPRPDGGWVSDGKQFTHIEGKACAEDCDEPVDVPAIQVRPKCAGGCVPPPPYWTCADNSRILLTAENGSRHCLKLGVAAGIKHKTARVCDMYHHYYECFR